MDINTKYRNIEEIKEALDKIKDINEKRGDTAVHNFFRYPESKKLQLTVEVNDPELVNVLLSSEWSNNGLFPGMTVTDVRFEDLDRNDVVVEWLKKKLDELEYKTLNDNG